MRYTWLLMSIILFAVPAYAEKPGGPYSLYVRDSFYGSYTQAEVTGNSRDDYILVQCYTPNGDYVYSEWAVIIKGVADIGPLLSAQWRGGSATCVASLGCYARRGWGKWQLHAQSKFEVYP